MFNATTARQSGTGVGVGVGVDGNGTNNEIVFIGVQRVNTNIAVRIRLRNYIEFGIRSISIGGSRISTHNNDDTERINGGETVVSLFQKLRVLLKETDVLWNVEGNTNRNGSRIVSTDYNRSGGGTNFHEHLSGLVQYF